TSGRLKCSVSRRSAGRGMRRNSPCWMSTPRRTTRPPAAPIRATTICRRSGAITVAATASAVGPGLPIVPMPPAIADATVISRSPSVLAAEVDGEIVMMSIEEGRYFGLDDIASDIWKRIEQPCSFAGLIDRLAADYD